MPLDERRFRGAEEQDGMSDLLGRAHPPHGRDVDGGPQPLDHLGGARGHGRLNDARAHAVDADAVGRVVDGVGPGHVDDGGLGGAVGGGARPRHDAELAGNVDDGAPGFARGQGFLLEHGRQRSSRGQPRTSVIYIVDGVKDGHRRLCRSCRFGQNASTIDGVVEAFVGSGYISHERALVLVSFQLLKLN